MSRLTGSNREPAHPPMTEGSLTIIAHGTRVKGDVETDGVVKVEGEVVGGVRAGRQVLVGKEGRVEGDVVTREAIVGGVVQGSIVAEERVELQSSCTVTGDIATKRVLVEEGSRLNGAMRMGDPVALERTPERVRPGTTELGRPAPRPTPQRQSEFAAP